MNEPTLKLQRNADELLREFPGSEPDFEAQASAIEARLKGSPGGVVFDDLLRVPELAPEPGEGSMPSSVRAAAAPKSNFAEMARKSVQKQHDATELAKELLAATAHSRRPNAEMVERVRAAGRATATPLPTTETAADEARPSGVVTRAVAPAAVRAAPSNNDSNRIGIIFGVVGSLVAIAACVALFLKSGQDDGRSSAANLAAAQKANDAPAAAAPAPAAATPAAKSNEGVVSPEALKEAPAAAAREVAAGAALKSGGASAPLSAPAVKAAPSASAVAQQVVLEEDPEPAQAAPVEPKATPAPAAEPPLKPAEGNTGSVPLSPSGGAISTALSSVRGSAQACLAGQTEPVNAVVTFAADGHVLRVTAGGPAGACIQAALSKARIAPFAKESFSAPTTIRPP
jgi:hypothetical protein